MECVRFNRNIMGCKVDNEVVSISATAGFNRNIMGCKESLQNNLSEQKGDLIGT